MFQPLSISHNWLFLIWPCSNASAQSDKERNVPKSLRSNLLPSSSHHPESRTLYQTTATIQHKTHRRPQLYFLTFRTSLNLWPKNPIYVHVHDALLIWFTCMSAYCTVDTASRTIVVLTALSSSTRLRLSSARNTRFLKPFLSSFSSFSSSFHTRIRITTGAMAATMSLTTAPWVTSKDRRKTSKYVHAQTQMTFPCRKMRLFHHIHWPHHNVWSAVSLN